MKKSALLIIVIFSQVVLLTSCLSTKIDIGKKTDLCALEYPNQNDDFIIRVYGVLDSTKTKLQVTQLYWFDNWRNGWTEIRFAASGEISIEKKKIRTIYTITQPLKLEFPEAAKVRFKDTYLTGQDALKAVNNRLSRIESINEVLAEKFELFEKKRFNLRCGAYLFPEKYKESIEFFKLDLLSKKILGDGTYWNENYTKEVFPEYMWEARNSGTFYRDWEEANDLIYILFNWNIIFKEGQQVKFSKIKTTAPKRG